MNVRNALCQKIHSVVAIRMSHRYWIFIVASGLIALGSPGQAQDQPAQSGRQADVEQAPSYHLPFTVPVDIVEDKPATAAREREEADARQREKEDLIAQQGMNAATQAMNDATQRMADYALWSTILVGIGTALLFITLYLTRQANSAAQAAVDVTREIGEAQVRPYIGLGEVRWISHPLRDKPDKIFWRLSFELSNTGQSPTRKLRYKAMCVVAPTIDADSIDGVEEKRAQIGAHGTLGVCIRDVSSEEMTAVMRGETRIHFLCQANYGNMINRDSQHVTRIGLVSSDMDGDPTKMWTVENNVHIRFSYITGFNCTDEDCQIAH